MRQFCGTGVLSYTGTDLGEAIVTNQEVSPAESHAILAAIRGDVDALEDALRTEDVNIADDDGWTALHIGARTGNLKIVQVLLASPLVDVNAKNKWKSTPLMIAAGSGNLAIVELLLRHPGTQIDLRAEYYGRTATIEAAVKGHVAVVKILVSHGANVNATDKTGRNSALVESLKNGHAAVATYLLRSGLVDFSDSDLRLQALIWCGSRGGELLRKELDTAIGNYFASMQRAAS
jgi:ankyrin repeat protein